MRFTKQIILLTFFLAACATTDNPSTGEVELAIDESACTDKEASFDDYYAVSQCAKSNPGRVLATIGAIVEAGGTCTATDESKNCTSIEPIDDKLTLERSSTGVRCYDFYCRYVAGVWTCTSVPSCCIRVDDGTQTEICWPTLAFN